MITYTPIGKTNDSAQKVSEYFWELIIPLVNRNASYVTKYLLSVIEHPISKEKALVIDDEAPLYEFTISPDVTDTEIDQKTEALQTAGVLLITEKNNLRAGLKGNKNKKVNVKSLLPARYASISKAAAQTAGWFADSILPN